MSTIIDRVLPKISSIEPIAKIGFYSFYNSCRCILKGCNDNLVLDQPLFSEQVTRASLIGRFYHEIMEEISRIDCVEKFKDHIEICIRKYQLEVGCNPHFRTSGGFGGWREVNVAASRAIERFRTKGNGIFFSEEMGIEQTLISNNGRFVGRPDFFAIKNNECRLSELKSSSIREENGKLKDEYSRQILFYSFILFHNFQIQSVRALLESMLGDSETLIISKEEAEDYYKECCEKLVMINERISSTQIQQIERLTNPSKSECTYCIKNIICPAFKSKQLSLKLDGAHFIVSGILKNNNQKAPHANYVEIFDEYLGGNLKIKMSKSRSSKLELNQKYLISELQHQEGQFTESQLTQVYRQND